MKIISNKTFAFPKLSWKKIIFIFLCLLYLVVASLQSLVPHYQFLTNNWDLGYMNQFMYKLSHFKNPTTTLLHYEYPTFFLGDHVTLLMPLNSQFYWIFGSYTLLVLQIFYGLIGASGLYKVIRHKFESENFALIAVLLFFTHYSLYAALDFDAHDNVYGMMFLPWILYFYYKENFKAFIISLGIFLLAREDLSLTSMMLGICFLIFEWREKLKYGATCFIISFLYFLLAFKFVIPHFSPMENGGYNAWKFGNIGNSMSDIINLAVYHPGKIISYLADVPEKQDKIKYFLYTGGILFFGIAN